MRGENKMILKLIDSNGIETEILQSDSHQEIQKEMSKKIDELGFNDGYTRWWATENGIMIDYGSWSNFFKIEGTTNVMEFMSNGNKEI